MTEQQQHLTNLIQQRQTLTQELEGLTTQMTSRKELFLKVQGAIEYLQQIGIVLPESEETDGEVSEESGDT
jgi:hypothetical protein